MTVIAIILAGSAPLQLSSPRDLVNMRQPHFARSRASQLCDKRRKRVNVKRIFDVNNCFTGD